jgi:hypothetical protein
MVRKSSVDKLPMHYFGVRKAIGWVGCLKRRAILISVAILTFGTTPYAAADSSNGRQTPVKQKLPITAESFCKGAEYVLKRQRQGAEKEMAQLCNGATPTELLKDLIRSPYSGGDNYRFRTINLAPISSSSYVSVNVAYSMRVKKSAVDLLLAEEGMIKDQTYANGDGASELNVAVKLLPVDLSKAPLPNSEADTAFSMIQRSTRRSGQRQFDNVSSHDLRLYRMNPDNYDFMMSIRSLNNPAVDGRDAIFRHGIVIRAAMTDPNDSSSGISITLVNFEVSDQRNQDAKVEDVFASYMNRDIRAVYRYHTKN